MKFSGSDFVMFILLTNCLIIGQPNYWNNYSGIPIIAHTNLTTGDLLQNDSSLGKMVELGVYGFIATDINSSRYDSIKNSGLKIIPYQLDVYGAGIPNLIAYYTDAVYSVWEAEGKGDSSMGNTEILYNSSLGEIFYEQNNVSGIRTKNNAHNKGKLIYGPYYDQAKKYKYYDSEGKIYYTADFRLKIDTIPGVPIPGKYNLYKDSIVCEIQVMPSNGTGQDRGWPIISKVLRVKDFLDNGAWNTWLDFSLERYTLDSLLEKNKSSKELPEGSSSGDFTTEHMQYRVIWEGRTFLRLFVDKITVSDERGIELLTDQDRRGQIKNMVSTYNDPSSNIIAWYGLDEPWSIDNYLCYRIVDSLIKEINGNLGIYTTFTAGWMGKYGGPYCILGASDTIISPSTEYAKKSGSDFVMTKKMNLVK